ncbi:MAG: crotonase/enoyl-CoA hydratase family protein [Burkholderiaceae bacterium]|jgi:enoyl-CoA hydratase/carnithine racemase
MTPSPAQPSGDNLLIAYDGDIALIGLNRPQKRNALSDALIAAIHRAFVDLPQAVRAVVIHGVGEHFSAGLDLSELGERTAAEGLLHSRSWHQAFDAIQSGRVPVVAALHGAVVGGGLELAAAAHIRVAGRDAFFGLPEGQRGLFVGGGGSVRISRLIGVGRMTDMMLAGRIYDGVEAERIGLVQYLTDPGQALERATEVARRIAKNAPLSNFAVMHALPRIARQAEGDGLLTESLMAAVAQSDVEAKARMQAFLDGKASKVGKPE